MKNYKLIFSINFERNTVDRIFDKIDALRCNTYEYDGKQINTCKFYLWSRKEVSSEEIEKIRKGIQEVLYEQGLRMDVTFVRIVESEY